MITYAHASKPKGPRFRQSKADPVPKWAVDVRDATEADADCEERITLTVSISAALARVIPDAALIEIDGEEWEDYSRTGKPKIKPTGEIERLATDAYDRMVDPKFSRDVGIGVIANQLSEAAMKSAFVQVVLALLDHDGD